MKVLIWFFCFFMLAVVQMLFKDTGIILGGIPTLILAGLAFWSKDKLCVAWDKHTAKKAASRHLAIDASSDPTQSNTRLCKLCGDPIDPVTRKCTGCRKQYFHPPVFTGKHYFIAATAVACAVIAILIFALVSQRSSYEAQIAELNVCVSEQTAAVSDLQQQILAKDTNIKLLRDRIDGLNEEIVFYEHLVVFALDDGSNEYHTYDCLYRKYSNCDYWILNTADAESQGYEPHFCCD